MNENKILDEGITFDDVLLVPAYSEVLPREVDTSTYLTRDIKLNIPLLSAAMDTVTEAKMAIAMAQEGGIGVIHKNLSIEDQALEVKKVKRAENGMIIDPITIFADNTVGDALKIMSENHIGGIPVVDANRKLIGIVTNRDLRFENNYSKPIFEVMTKDNLITVNEFTDFNTAEAILQKYKIEKLPVIDKNGVLIGLITYKDIMKLRERPNSCKDDLGRLRVAAAVGITTNTLERVEALLSVNADAIVVDTAHGQSAKVLETIKKIKSTFKNIQLIAGNIATADGAQALADAGADGVKVGIGPGSICTTRVIAGVGVPQLSAIMFVASVLKDKGIPIIADGGIRYTGDIVKALAAGASSVMIGSLFAGVDEAPGETIILEGRKYKVYRGMGSIEAMQQGSKDRYFQDMEEDIKKLVPEGIVGRVPYKGNLSEVVYQMIGGLRSGMGYCGAKTIKNLRQAKFIHISNAGITESHPHDVTIIREAPNYSR
ncbi:MAG: IMP dehydrogenase [Bacteroidales bacterium]